MTKAKAYLIYIPLTMGFIGSFCLGLDWDNDRDHGDLNANFPYAATSTDNLNCSGNTNLGDCTSIKEDEKTGDDTIIRRLLGVFGLKKDKNDDLKFIDYARAILNLTLTLIAFIALIMSIYTFYLIIFSENEAGIKKAKGNLIGIFIALGIIGLSRLITSVIYRRYQKYRLAEQDKIPIMTDQMLENQQ